jgi:cell division protease FtsH
MSDSQSGGPGNDKRKPKNQGPQFPFGGPHLPDPKHFGGWKFSIVYILILIVGMSLFNYVFLSRVNPTIDFSEFKGKIAT